MQPTITNKEGETCIICEQQKGTGFHLYTSFICLDCEQKIIQTSPNDPTYKHFIRKLKAINHREIFLK